MSGSIVDEDTARTINSGRETAGAVLSTIQTHLQKVFVVFLVGFLGMFYSLRVFIWDWLKAVTTSSMPPEVAAEQSIIVQTPFEVILLQAKIGLVAGIIVAIPPLLYLSRDDLRARGYWPQTPVARWKLASLAGLSGLLFLAGLAYAYGLFFPLMLGFLAQFSLSVGVTPAWSIVKWTQLLVLLTISFGLAAQLPLIMSSLAYAEIIPYESFRDNWRYAIVGIFVFGAAFSPPDPLTQLMWALPLIVLYAFSLGLTRFIINLKRGANADIRAALWHNAGRLFGASLLLAAGTYAALVSGGGDYLNDAVLEPRNIALPWTLWLQDLLGVSREVALAVGTAVVVFLIVFVVLSLYYLFTSVNASARERAGGRMGDPAEIDLAPLDADGVRAAPRAAFADLDEEEALDLARSAIDNDNGEKAQAILDRFDAVHEGEHEGSEGDAGEAAGTESEATEGSDRTAGNVVEDTATGMMDAFTDEKDEDDIGGYLYDMRYIADSLRSRLFRIFVVFGLVLAGAFTFFYMGGVRVITEDFVSRMPRAVIGVEDIRIIDLHPVETLIFIVKVSTLLAALAVVPMVLYYAWPAMKDRGLTAGQRSVVYEWTAAFAVALVSGTVLGYYYIAPGIISYLVYDATQAGMVISYQISKFSWLIIYTTVGVGLLACVPVTMWMLFRGRIASYRAMRDRWREVTIAVFAIAGVFTPVSVLTMFLVAIPTMVAYGIGLGALWAITLGGRRDYTDATDIESDAQGADGSTSKWFGVILVVLVLVGVGVAATGGLGALVSIDGPTEVTAGGGGSNGPGDPATPTDTADGSGDQGTIDAGNASSPTENGTDTGAGTEGINRSDAGETPANTTASDTDEPTTDGSNDGSGGSTGESDDSNDTTAIEIREPMGEGGGNETDET